MRYVSTKGRRLDPREKPGKKKLNVKKIVALIIAIIVIVMLVLIINKILTKGKETGRIASASYYTSYKDNKWGVINSNGEDVITPSYEELIVIPNNKKDVFLLTYNVNYETGEYQTKALNSKSEELFTEYNQVEALANYDKSGAVWYENNLIKVKKDDKYGLINLDGKEVLPVEYEEIVSASEIENAFIIRKEGKYGIANREGNIIITPEYASIQNLGTNDKAGYIVGNEENKFGIVDYSNNKILDTKYDEIQKVSGVNLYVVKEDGENKIIDKDGKDIEEEVNFDTVKSISEIQTQTSGIVYEKNKKYGFATLEGDVKIRPTYEDLTEAKPGILIAKKDSKFGIIDNNGEELLPFESSSISYNKEADLYIVEDENFNAKILDRNLEEKLSGMFLDIDTDKDYIKMRIGEDYKYYNFQFEEEPVSKILSSNNLFMKKENGKYGFVNNKGEQVVECIYDDATEQNEDGYAGIKKDGKWGSINQKGEVVVEPKYDLDEYLSIDFIGKWHKGPDLNMNYYSQQ